MSDVNPWLTRTVAEVPPAALPAPVPAVRQGGVLGPAAPQPGVPVPDMADRLPRAAPQAPALLWWLGVHGGAGESTLAAMAGGTRAAGHAWPVPVPPSPAAPVVLVARTSFAGLSAAQRAATEWAAGQLGRSVELLGLVLIADAPGRAPRQLRHLEEVVVGGVPRTWRIAWHEPWRLGERPALESAPADVRRLFAELSLIDPASR